MPRKGNKSRLAQKANELPDSVRIHVRFRPIMGKEQESKSLHVLNGGLLRMDGEKPGWVSEPSATPRRLVTSPFPGGSTPSSARSTRRLRTSPAHNTPRGGSPAHTVNRKAQLFQFHNVFNPETTTAQLYKEAATPLVEYLFEGYNGTIMAYGISGSGKTHTMIGNPQEPGFVPRTIQELLDRAESKEEDSWQIHLSMSVVQVYMEKVLDLLVDSDVDLEKTPSLNLRQRMNPTGQEEIYVDGAQWKRIKTVRQGMNLVSTGNTNRVVASTGMNSVSSRSHVVFMFRLRQVNIDTQEQVTSTLYLVDLAGSETVKRTGATGLVLKQAGHVNQSLSALSNVISALSQEKPFVPYRDSKLTRLLTHALGGNSKTAIVLNCSPAEQHLTETNSTLQFGKRALDMPNEPKINKVRASEDYKRLYETAKRAVEEQKAIIEGLKQENHRLKEELDDSSDGETMDSDEDVEDSEHRRITRSFADLKRGLNHIRKSLGDEKHLELAGAPKEPTDSPKQPRTTQSPLSNSLCLTDDTRAEVPSTQASEVQARMDLPRMSMPPLSNHGDDSSDDEEQPTPFGRITLPPVTRTGGMRALHRPGEPPPLTESSEREQAQENSDLVHAIDKLNELTDLYSDQKERDQGMRQTGTDQIKLNVALVATGSSIILVALTVVLLMHLKFKMAHHPAFYVAWSAAFLGGVVLGCGLPPL